MRAPAVCLRIIFSDYNINENKKLLIKGSLDEKLPSYELFKNAQN